MELQALVIEGEAGAGAAEAAAAACDAAAAAEEAAKLRDQLAHARIELRLTRADARGRADENEVLAGRAEGEEGGRRRGGADGAVVSDGNRRLGTDHGTRFPHSTSGTDFTSGTDDYGKDDHGKDFVSREERRSGPPRRRTARRGRESRRR